MNEYQTKAAQTAVYPHAGTGDMTALAYIGLGLGEAGEIQGKLKKVIRDDNGVLSDEARIGLMKELGDLQWYIAMLAREISVPLDVIASHNLDKLADRLERGVIGGSGDER